MSAGMDVRNSGYYVASTGTGKSGNLCLTLHEFVVGLTLRWAAASSVGVSVDSLSLGMLGKPCFRAMRCKEAVGVQNFRRLESSNSVRCKRCCSNLIAGVLDSVGVSWIGYGWIKWSLLCQHLISVSCTVEACATAWEVGVLKVSHSRGIAWRLALAPRAKVLGPLGYGYIER